MPSRVEGLGLAPRKKTILHKKNYGIMSKFLVLLSYITAESGGDYPLVLKVGDLSPYPPPCSDTDESAPVMNEWIEMIGV